MLIELKNIEFQLNMNIFIYIYIYAKPLGFDICMHVCIFMYACMHAICMMYMCVCVSLYKYRNTYMLTKYYWST